MHPLGQASGICKATHAAHHPPSQRGPVLCQPWLCHQGCSKTTPNPHHTNKPKKKPTHKKKKKPNTHTNTTQQKTHNLTFSKGSAHAIVFSSQCHYLFNKSSAVGVIPPAPLRRWRDAAGCCRMLRDAGAGSLSYSSITIHSSSDIGSKHLLYQGEAAAVNPVALYT